MHTAQTLRGQFLGAMGRAVNGVNIVTTDGPAGRAGATVSAMASVSADMDPPTLLVCLNHQSATAQALIANGVFCLNILSEAQWPVAERFARRIAGEDDKFAGARWAPGATGAWGLVGAVARFDCRVLKTDLVGTHHIIIGSAEAVAFSEEARTLLYGGRRYCAAADLPDPL